MLYELPSSSSLLSDDAHLHHGLIGMSIHFDLMRNRSAFR